MCLSYKHGLWNPGGASMHCSRISNGFPMNTSSRILISHLQTPNIPSADTKTPQHKSIRPCNAAEISSHMCGPRNEKGMVLY